MRAGWQTKTLGEACKFIDYRGHTPKKTDSGLRLITAKNVKMGILNEDPKEFVSPDIYDSWMIRGIPNYGDVLITTEAPLANIAQLDTSEKVVFAQRIIILQANKAELNSSFLKYILTSSAVQQRIHENGTGATVKGIKASLLKTIDISFPISLREQQRIVAILDEAFEGIATAVANAEQNLINAREIFETTAEYIFENNGLDWEKKSFSEICEISSKLIDPRERKYLDMLHIGGANIESKTGQLLDLKSSKDEGLISGKFLFDKTMVLYSKIRPYLMKVARPDFSGLCSADIYPLSAKAGKLDKDFLYHLLLSKKFTEYANLGSARAGMPKVNRDHLFAFQCNAPSIETQSRLAKRLDSLLEKTQQLEDIYRQKLIALDELKKSILNQAFSGQLN